MARPALTYAQFAAAAAGIARDAAKWTADTLEFDCPNVRFGKEPRGLFLKMMRGQLDQLEHWEDG